MFSQNPATEIQCYFQGRHRLRQVPERQARRPPHPDPSHGGARAHREDGGEGVCSPTHSSDLVLNFDLFADSLPLHGPPDIRRPLPLGHCTSMPQRTGMSFLAFKVLDLQDVDKFLLLGQTKDSSPGEVIDKVARRLKLQALIPHLRDASGM